MRDTLEGNARSLKNHHGRVQQPTGWDARLASPGVEAVRRKMPPPRRRPSVFHGQHERRLRPMTALCRAGLVTLAPNPQVLPLQRVRGAEPYRACAASTSRPAPAWRLLHARRPDWAFHDWRDCFSGACDETGQLGASSTGDGCFGVRRFAARGIHIPSAHLAILRESERCRRQATLVSSPTAILHSATNEAHEARLGIRGAVQGCSDPVR
jgi:hypothetical protein